MNHLGNLHYAEGSRKRKQRIGRGQGTRRGGTSGRGHKGAQSRSGYRRKIGFEGGQMPMHRRLPKFGFTNINRKDYLPVNLTRIDELVTKGFITDGVVTPEILYTLGVIAKRRVLVKILGNGAVTGKLDVTAHAFSSTAKEKIEAVGGTAHVLTV
jgi:large subunit ribosomal protein L15